MESETTRCTTDLTEFARHSAEHGRLVESEMRRADWKNWGPYVSDRAWGTVREDYSADGDAWSYFPHDHARSRVYRWNEDGLGGFCNRYQNIALAVALWNEADPFLKERLFGLTGPQGNNGEDVKEIYYYLDSTPTHAYAKMLYRYPQVAYPYAELVAAAAQRRQGDPEPELVQLLADAFEQGRYFDVIIEYAKADNEDILCRITALNHGPEPAPLHILPHLWYRNDWAWGYDRSRPVLRQVESAAPGLLVVQTTHRHLGDRFWYLDTQGHADARLLFTENETNRARLFGQENPTPYVKDAFHAAVVDGEWDRVNPAQTGSKAAGHYRVMVAPGESVSVRTRFAPVALDDPLGDFDAIFARRQAEADEFYAVVQPTDLDDEARAIQRQAFAGLLWTKQYYHYSVELWLDGDPAGPPPPAARRRGRNADWRHLYNTDVISMPDKWEYPWYAAWDLAFHMLPVALIDPEWAKRQMLLMLREWYMHPNGQIPAYEWNFSDVNPPVHAWAAWRVYQITREVTGQADVEFLEKVFHKLLLNFTWWVNRKDAEGQNVFQGGFLGLDNIGVFDRSRPLEFGARLEQADGTAWMGMYCLKMLAMALELARTRPAYEDVATKFFEHFVLIGQAINRSIDAGGLWDERDGFYYDALRLNDGAAIPLRLRSLVGLIPLFAVETLDAEMLERLPDFARRMEWFIRYRQDWVHNIATLTETGQEGRRLLSLLSREQLERILQRLVDPAQFLSEFGVRSMSAEYRDRPFRVVINGTVTEVCYEPAESRSGMFGGNSNWRGPIWFPVNYLMMESLRKYQTYYGDDLRVELPTGEQATPAGVATEIGRRLVRIFRRDATGRRPVFGGETIFHGVVHWRDNLLFYEYFHGDNGAGLGASHQTGWTALVAKIIHERCGDPDAGDRC